MEAEQAERALARIEAALARIEAAAARPPQADSVRPDTVLPDKALAERHERLRGEVALALRQIDQLIAAQPEAEARA